MILCPEAKITVSQKKQNQRRLFVFSGFKNTLFYIHVCKICRSASFLADMKRGDAAHNIFRQAERQNGDKKTVREGWDE